MRRAMRAAVALACLAPACAKAIVGYFPSGFEKEKDTEAAPKDAGLLKAPGNFFQARAPRGVAVAPRTRERSRLRPKRWRRRGAAPSRGRSREEELVG